MRRRIAGRRRIGIGSGRIKHRRNRTRRAGPAGETCADGVASPYALADLQQAWSDLGVSTQVQVLRGGNAAWAQAAGALASGPSGLLAQRIDRYRRPYEGTRNAHAAMQAYLDWEFGLVEQLRRDGTHHFQVI